MQKEEKFVSKYVKVVNKIFVEQVWPLNLKENQVTLCAIGPKCGLVCSRFCLKTHCDILPMKTEVIKVGKNISMKSVKRCEGSNIT